MAKNRQFEHLNLLYLIGNEISRTSEFSFETSKIHLDLLAKSVFEGVEIAGKSVDELGLLVDHFSYSCSVNVVFWHVFKHFKNSLLEGLDLWNWLVLDLNTFKSVKSYCYDTSIPVISV